MSKVIMVALAINLGQHPAMGTERLNLFFDTYPTHADVEQAIQEEDKDGRYAELFSQLEVDDILDFQGDFESEGFISFEVSDDSGTVLIQELDVHSSSNVEME